jgi:hypothetical protein
MPIVIPLRLATKTDVINVILCIISLYEHMFRHHDCDCDDCLADKVIIDELGEE